ncbi:unnamed protein product [Spirodela intermedia]|uniref:Uncharacterized protein n=1 Tax=Spirodela intermedia TaxID=51605 RepID=A0A7I8IQW7_SPIIN|nr:unnamed protein product [Spirodela intermedia]CAA6659401.1 unnamed protein product [Spirodela intermedia]
MSGAILPAESTEDGLLKTSPALHRSILARSGVQHIDFCPPYADPPILEMCTVPDKCPAITDSRCHGVVAGASHARGGDALAAAGEEIRVTDLSEGVAAVDVDGGLHSGSCGHEEDDEEQR